MERVLTNYQIYRALKAGKHPFHVYRRGRVGGDVGRKHLVWGKDIEEVKVNYRPDKGWKCESSNIPSYYKPPKR